MSAALLGLHIGTMHDATILDKYPPALEWWEWGMGDGAFKANPNIMIKVQQPPDGILTRNQIRANTIFNHWRLRVEHIVGEVKRHAMFSGVYRGSFAVLQAAIKLITHTTNIKLRLAPPRYRVLGPWSHCPDDALENERNRKRAKL